ncbi:MAG: ACP S-malonyltransferase [Neisseriaceae bacterium]
MSFAFVFPGQGSQSLKMMDKFNDVGVIENLFETTKKIMDIDFLTMLQEDTPDNINKTINTQPLLLCASYATYLTWIDKTQKEPEIVAGHSLGEWTALVAAGVIKFEDALRLVKLRAEFMQEAVKPSEGAMAVVLGLEDEKVIEVCEDIQKNSYGVVSGVNFNSPGQVVIAGDKKSVDLASTKLKEQGAKRVQILPVSVPSHCMLMKPAADKLVTEINKIEFATPRIKVLHNVNASECSNIAEIKDALIKQLYSPVLWTKTIQDIVTRGIKHIIECGPGKVLSGLNKRISEDITCYNLHSLDDIEKVNMAL